MVPQLADVADGVPASARPPESAGPFRRGRPLPRIGRAQCSRALRRCSDHAGRRRRRDRSATLAIAPTTGPASAMGRAPTTGRLPRLARLAGFASASSGPGPSEEATDRRDTSRAWRSTDPRRMTVCTSAVAPWRSLATSATPEGPFVALIAERLGRSPGDDQGVLL
jgi:hypothetical protein